MTHFMDASVALYDQGVADEKARCDAEVTMLREQLALAFEAGRVAEREEIAVSLTPYERGSKMKLCTLLESVSTTTRSVDGHHWTPIRPQTAENTFIKHRIRAAWLVLTGKADVVEWDTIDVTPLDEEAA